MMPYEDSGRDGAIPHSYKKKAKSVFLRITTKVFSGGRGARREGDVKARLRQLVSGI